MALKKRVVAWFSLSCDQEIELYGRGEKVLADVDSRPCWKRSCRQPVKCHERVDMEEAAGALVRQGEACLKEKKGASS